ncbi:MAG: HutD family protein [Psychrilyobacter sp.]|nr:HutD family protein [Psychrilyobacter sp.]
MQRVLNYENLKQKKWNGGNTKEYYKDKVNFGIRVSSATIDKGESRFSDFTGYKRILSVLKNSVELNINGISTTLKKDSFVEFKGSDKVLSKCEDEIIDFNIIWREEEFLVEIKKMEINENARVENSIFIISLVDNNNIIINDSTIALNKYDGYVDTENNLKKIQSGNKCLVVNFSSISN